MWFVHQDGSGQGCSKKAGMMGKDCDKLLESCMMFDMAADYYCEGCEACLDRCQVNTIHMRNDIAVITQEIVKRFLV